MNKKRAISGADCLPARKTLVSLRAAVQDCRGCDLWKLGTQGVFGERRALSQYFPRKKVRREVFPSF